MKDFADLIVTITGIWVAIILFITAPIWIVPTIIISNIIDFIKNRRRR